MTRRQLDRIIRRLRRRGAAGMYDGHYWIVPEQWLRMFSRN